MSNQNWPGGPGGYPNGGYQGQGPPAQPGYPSWQGQPQPQQWAQQQGQGQPPYGFQGYPQPPKKGGPGKIVALVVALVVAVALVGVGAVMVLQSNQKAAPTPKVAEPTVDEKSEEPSAAPTQDEEDPSAAPTDGEDPADPSTPRAVPSASGIPAPSLPARGRRVQIKLSDLPSSIGPWKSGSAPSGNVFGYFQPNTPKKVAVNSARAPIPMTLLTKIISNGVKVAGERGLCGNLGSKTKQVVCFVNTNKLGQILLHPNSSVSPAELKSLAEALSTQL